VYSAKRRKMSEYKRTFDYHVHESHSKDAAATSIRDIVKTAEAKRIDEVAFTTHMITGGVDHGFGIQPDEIQGYFDGILDAQEGTDVTLRVGLEVDYFPEEERNIERVLDEYPFDFILGSVHRVHGLSIASRGEATQFFSGRPLRESINEYLGVWNKAIESGLFDVMAHPDYFKKYLPALGYPILTFEDFTPTIYDSFDKLANYNVGFEVNTSSTRHGSGMFFPVNDFVKAARQTGVKTITVGSDTHVPETLGFNIPKALDLLEKSGYGEVSVFRGRKRAGVRLEELKSRSIEGGNDLVIPLITA
jgi:histidinol-phosphatase (PHP family)